MNRFDVSGFNNSRRSVCNYSAHIRQNLLLIPYKFEKFSISGRHIKPSLIIKYTLVENFKSFSNI